jgi:hypothetical protein
MKKFLAFTLILVRFYIIFKVITLLYFTKVDPNNYHIDNLIWWGVFLIFDIWLQFILPKEDSE